MVWKLVGNPRSSKWFKASRDLKEGDIVLFLKQESELCNVYQYGIVESVQRSRDGKFRKAVVRYRNHNEQVHRTTFRAARSLVVIHRVDEVSVMQELGEIACQVDAERRNAATKWSIRSVGECRVIEITLYNFSF